METNSSPIERAASSACLSTSTRSEPSDGGRVAVAADRGQRVERLVGAAAHRLGVGVRAPQHRHDDPAVLLEQREQHVMGRHLRVAARAGEPLCGCDGLLGLDCEAILLHSKSKSGALRF